MLIETNKSLESYNTLGFSQRAEYFCAPASIDELHEALAFARQRSLAVFMLGEGSNIVLCNDVPGLTVNLAISKVDYASHAGNTLVNAQAGVNWHSLVLASIEHGLYGLENLSLIPGNAGAAPIQNIGAYGVEFKDLLTRVDAVHIASGESRSFTNAECQFGYRDSIFKRDAANLFAITGIELRLSNSRNINTHYQALQTELDSKRLAHPTADDISAAVCRIRRSKLPDPAVIGNAGSFFKNPSMDASKLETLRQQWPDIPWHPQTETQVKVPAGWLVEQSGWKGKRVGAVGVHDKQALVLVNHGGGNGTQLMELADTIRRDVQKKFGVVLEREPSVV